MTNRLDILLLVLDAQRADRLSCYGYPIETSPHLDALAAEATLFSNAVAAAQWTIPSHASMFTGLYPSLHRVFQQDSALPTELPTLAERLRRANYFTAGFSNNPFVGILNNGLCRGFNSFQNYGGLLTLRPGQAEVHAGAPGDLRRSLRNMLVKLLSRAQNIMAHSHTLHRFWFSQPVVPLWQTALKIRGNLKGDTVQSLDDAAQLLIKRHGTAPDQPLFIFVNLMGAHIPFDPPRWAMERFAPHVWRSPMARLFLWRFNAQIYHWLGPLPHALDPGRQEILNALYDAEVATQDERVGTFLKRLRSSGVLEHTLLIVVADHGELIGEKQLMGHAFSAYEGLTHVPLLIRSPLGDLPPGTRVTPFVSTRRVFHTVLTAAGAATPAEEMLALARVDTDDPDQGIVFAEAEPLQSAVHLIENRRPGLLQALNYDKPHRAVYEGEYKLITIGEHHSELYAVRDDPKEVTDLAQGLPKRVETLRERLQGFMQQAHNTAAGVAQSDNDLIKQRLNALGY